jgi:HK97 family phage prohead protease
MRFYWPIAKVDAAERMVWGYASTEAEDDQGESVTRAALAAALDDYMRFANIREMHQPSAVGVAREAELDDKGLHLVAKIVDDEAWHKVVEGVYKGFSIGGRVTARDAAANHVITGVDLLEISLVDRPANPEAVIELYKAKPEAADAAKVGARHSREDLARLQQMHDLAAELGAACPGAPQKHAHADELAKPMPLADQVADLAKRIEALEAQPLPPRALQKAIAFSKEEDGAIATAGGGETVDAFVARLRGLPAEKRALELTKLALKFPRPMGK